MEENFLSFIEVDVSDGEPKHIKRLESFLVQNSLFTRCKEDNVWAKYHEK